MECSWRMPLRREAKTRGGKLGRWFLGLTTLLLGLGTTDSLLGCLRTGRIGSQEGNLSYMRRRMRCGIAGPERFGYCVALPFRATNACVMRQATGSSGLRIMSIMIATTAQWNWRGNLGSILYACRCQ